MTPARSADFARALALVRPVTRRRLYWTARAVLVSDPRPGAGLRRGLLLGLRRPRERRAVRARRRADRAARRRRPAGVRARDARPATRRSATRAGARRRRPVRGTTARTRRGRGAAGDGERRGAAGRRKSFDGLEPHELAQLYRLMSRLRARHAASPHAPLRARPPRPAHRHAPDPARAACAPGATRSGSPAAAAASSARGS